MGVKLLCQAYSLERAVGEITKLTVTFSLLGHETNELSESIKKYIERLETGRIELIEAAPAGKMRCFYCGVTNNQERNTCTQCGAPL